MNSNTRNLVLGLGVIINLIGIGATVGVMHQRELARHTINLGTVIVTPADAEQRIAADGTINMVLPPIVVTAADSEPRVADAKAPKAQPQQTQALDAEVLMQSLDTLSPGQYLEQGAAMNLLDTLAFDRAGR